MKKILFTFSLVFAVTLSLKAQKNESEIALREYFIDAEFFLAQEFYLDALSDFLQVYRRGYQENANINYRIGICYLNIPGQKDKSVPYLEKASKSVSQNYKESNLKEENAPIDVYLYLGNAYRVNNRLPDAIASYKQYKELLPDDEVNLHKYADKQIEACNIASSFMSTPIDIEFINLGENINSNNDDFKAVNSGDGNTLVYMHRLPFYDAVYYSTKVDGQWTEPENITPQLMSDGDQYITYVSYDGKTLLLTREDEFNSDIYISHFVDNRWSKSEPLGTNVNTKYWESHACMSKDGKKLYFTSNRRGGVGEMDIYVSDLTPEGIFGPAKNITELNTELNEDTPFITLDGKQLFFSSQGYMNMGGYDIFVSHLEEDNTWSVPENVGYPVSTTDDDLFYYPIENNKYALYSRIDTAGYGGMDVYKIQYPYIPEETLAELRPEDSEVTPEIAGTEIEEIVTGGEEKIQVGTIEAQIDSIQTEEPKTETAPVVPEVKTIQVQPVFFDFDKTILSEESKNEINYVIKLLLTYPVIRAEITGYTDPLGPEYYNQRLSEQRAKAVYNYLLGKGIKPERLTYMGKGETGFIAVNIHDDGTDNPEGRKYNRRVEYVFLGVDNNEVIIRRTDPVPPELQIK